MCGRNHGFSLVELLIVVAVSSLIVLTISSVFPVLRKMNDTLVEDPLEGRVFEVITAIATDIHNADSISNVGPHALVLMKRGREISWRASSDRVVRREGRRCIDWRVNSRAGFSHDGVPPGTVKIFFKRSKVFALASVKGGVQ